MLQYFPMSKSLQFTYVFDDFDFSIDDMSEALFFLHECHWQGESILAYDNFHPESVLQVRCEPQNEKSPKSCDQGLEFYKVPCYNKISKK